MQPRHHNHEMIAVNVTKTISHAINQIPLIFRGVIIFALFMCVSCAGEEKVEAIPSAPPPLVPTRMSPEPTATFSIEPTLTKTVVATQKPSEIPPSSTPEPNPTSTPFIIGNAIPSLAPLSLDVPDPSQQYRLQAPSPINLIEVIKQAARVEINKFQNGSFYTGHSWNIYSFFNADLNRFYKDGLPDSQRWIFENPLLELAPYGPRPQWPIEVLEDGFIQYLNGNEVELNSDVQANDALRFTAQPVEIEDEFSQVWVVTVDFLNYNTRSFMLVTQIEEGVYQHLPDNLPAFSGRFYEDGDSFAITSHDLTGDGNEEILIENRAYMGGNSTDKNLWIFSWTEDQLSEIDTIEMYYYDSYYFEPTYAIDDFNGDTIEDIHVTQQHALSFGCAWESSDLYSWQGNQPQHVLQEDLPDTAACNLWRTVVPFNRSYSVQESERIPLLEHVVTQLREDESSEPDWLAYALFQLAIAYFEEGHYHQAKNSIDAIYSLSESSSYARFILENNRAEVDSVTSLCRNMIVNAEQALETNIGDYLTQASIRGLGYDWTFPDKPIICNLRELAIKTLENNPFSVNIPPAISTADLDLALSFEQIGNFDEDDELEWIAILEPEDPWLVIFDEVDEIWQPSYIDSLFYFPVLELEVAQYDITNDGRQDTIVRLKEDSSSYYAPSETVENFYLVDKVNGEFEIIAEADFYENPPDIEGLDLSHFNYEQTSSETINWRALEEFETESLYIGSYIAELTTLVLNQRDDDISIKINELLNYIPKDDPEASPYIEQLTLLLGYYYELNNDEEMAVNIYLDLIRQAPTSPWSFLAWAHLQPANE